VARIAVAHRNLDKQGGGEAVCMSVLEALQSEHDVIFVTTSDVRDLEQHNEYFGTEVRDIDVQTIKLGGVELARIMKKLDTVGSKKVNYFTTIASQAIYYRYCRQSIPNVDLFISTWDEVCTGYPSVLYIHAPTRYKYLMPDDELNYPQPIPWLVERYRSGARRFAGFDSERVVDATVFANSGWTASRIQESYGVRPDVLYPPINTEGLSSELQWDKREDGFVFLSRIHPGKNIKWLIKILRRVRDQGHDIHFHVIGPRDSDKPGYYDEVATLVAKHNFVTLEGPMYGTELNKMLNKHKYGINGAKTEQFGMSIAEMVAAGMIPFVPNGGGQTEVVNDQSEVLFNSTDEAVDKIAAVCENSAMAQEIRQGLPDVTSEFGTARFQTRIRDTVHNLLS
jgi:glycosyltransferase involved in cell wall biosynthesis